VRAWSARHADVVRVAAIGAATAIAVLSRGDLIVLAVVLAIAAFDLVAGAAALLVALAVMARLGTTSLAAMAGAQAVLGPAGATGPGFGALSAWLGALALVLVSPDGWAAVPFGATAALVVIGPAATSWQALLVRVLAMVAFIDVVLALRRWWPAAVTRPAGVVVGVAALVTGLVAAPPGGTHVSHAVRTAAVPEAVALLAAGVVLVLAITRLTPNLLAHLGRFSPLEYTPMHRRQPSGAGREGELQ
jgi:hypothetical protein